MMTTQLPRLRTAGRIAAELGTSISRVTYILATRDHIRPSALAGRVRLFDSISVAQIRHELNAIAAQRSGKGVTHE